LCHKEEGILFYDKGFNAETGVLKDEKGENKGVIY
jgi:hypothetical protein